MGDDSLHLKPRAAPGLPGHRRPPLSNRLAIVAMTILWMLVGYKLFPERIQAALAQAAGFIRYHTHGTQVTSDGALLRRMAICFSSARHNCVIDGDTVWVDGEKIRLAGIDAPEIDGRCSYERDLAQRASHRLSELLSAEPFTVSRSGTDRYGRTLGALHLQGHGDAGSILVREGLARVWTGRRMPWC